MIPLMKAISLMNRNLYDAAIEEFCSILTNEPQNAHAHAHLSMCLLHKDKKFAALEEARRALKADPELPICHLSLSVVLAALDDPHGAERALKEVLRIDPENRDALEIRCAIALRDRSATDLKSAAETLLTVQPDTASTHYFLSRAASLVGDGASAEKYARNALEIEANASNAHEAIGWAFLSQKQFADAKDAALSAVYLEPESGAAHALIAAVEMQGNRFTGWFHRIGHQVHTLNIKQAFKWAVPFFALYMIWLDTLDYFEAVGSQAVTDAAVSLADFTRYLVLFLLALFMLSGSRFSRKAVEYKKAAKLKANY